MRSLAVKLSTRHAQVTRRCLVEGLASLRLTPDERDAAMHALRRIDHEMTKHGVSPAPDQARPTAPTPQALAEQRHEQTSAGVQR